jgi:multidrug/hemolysin transport system ATP-binding protein
MEEAAKADYVVVIDHGEIAAKGTPSELKEQYSSDYMIVHGSDMKKLIEIVEKIGYAYKSNMDTLTILLKSTMDALPILEQCKEYITGFEVQKKLSLALLQKLQ